MKIVDKIKRRMIKKSLEPVIGQTVAELRKLFDWLEESRGEGVFSVSLADGVLKGSYKTKGG